MNPVRSAPPPEVVLAVDIGTSGARAFTYDERYAIQASAGAAIETISGPGGSSTQAWDQVRSAASACIREVAGRSAAPVAALVLSGTASCLAPAWLDHQGQGRIDEVILWSDTRASAEQAELDAIAASPGMSWARRAVSWARRAVRTSARSARPMSVTGRPSCAGWSVTIPGRWRRPVSPRPRTTSSS